jgi:carbamoyltransferase
MARWISPDAAEAPGIATGTRRRSGDPRRDARRTRAACERGRSGRTVARAAAPADTLLAPQRRFRGWRDIHRAHAWRAPLPDHESSPEPMKILGVSHPYSWNVAAALLVDGELVAFCEEERFSRVKHAPRSFPARAMDYCLTRAGLGLDEVDEIAIGMEQHWSTVVPNLWPPQPVDFLVRKLIRNFKQIGRGNGRMPFSRRDPRLHYCNHHLSHVASSFYVSGFDLANFISLDGSGGGESGMLGWGHGTRLHVAHRVTNAGSWGVLYELVTDRLGFRAHSHEGKTMGLAAYGDPDPDRFDFIDWSRPVPHIDRRGMHRHLRSIRRREPGEPFTDEHYRLAATVQAALERALLQMAQFLSHQSGSRTLCMAGGVALNCSANGKLLRSDAVDEIYVQPASSDAGVALGAAVLRHVQLTGERPRLVFDHAYWGPDYSDDEIEHLLVEAKIPYERADDIETRTADLLAQGQIVGWFQGRMEVGPRALGGRSILADPAIAGMKDKVNAEVKHREMWRPFAPSMLEEDVADYAVDAYRSPFMILAFQARPDRVNQFPAAVHVDDTARVQGVSRDRNPRYYRLIEEFKRITGRGVILNTSFNDAEEPLVCSPRDALRTFFATGLDVLVLGPFLVRKNSGATSVGARA